MLKEQRTNRVSSDTDDLHLVFECNGTRENNYDGMLIDCTEAVVQIVADYESGTEAGPGADALRQKVLNALDGILKGD